MPSLIAVYNSEGCVGRCDSKCYNAESPECDCICRGANHGKGLAKAQANTQAMAGQLIQNYSREHSHQKLKFEVEGQPNEQRDLFASLGLELL